MCDQPRQSLRRAWAWNRRRRFSGGWSRALCVRLPAFVRLGGTQPRGRQLRAGVQAIRHRWPPDLVERPARAWTLVLAFFSAMWCAGCDLDLRALEQARSAIAVRGAALVAISQQTVDTNLRTRHSVGACFPIPSDRGGRLSGMFGVRWRIPVIMRASHGVGGIDLPSLNGEGSWTCSVPARFVIARCGVIVYSEIHLFQTKPPDPCDLSRVLDTLRGARGG